MPEQRRRTARAPLPRARAKRAALPASARRRAIYDDEKEARRAELLAAARALFVENDGRLATVIEVAERAGVAKGTVYLYFQTKEEIYVAQYEELMTALLARMRDACARGGADVRARVVDAICGFVAEQPDLLRLGGLMNGVLEQNVSAEFVEEYKTRLGVALIATATAITEALAPLSFEDATQLFLRSYAITLGLWQQADLPRVVRSLLARRADLAFYEIDFARELRSALTLLWRAAPEDRRAT